jgi:hypothetical protein
MNAGIALSPLLPWPWIAVLAVLSAGLVALALVRGGRGALLRGGVLTVLLVSLLDPHWIAEEHRPLADVALVVVDRSESQTVGNRAEETRSALEKVRSQLAGFGDLQVREITVNSDDGEETRLWAAYSRAMADIPKGRFSGAVLITDGQIHDLPPDSPSGPIHVLLSGSPDERDRRLIVEHAPSYGVVGETVTIAYRIEDPGARETTARVTMRVNGTGETTREAPLGTRQEYSLEIDHAGPTVIEMTVQTAEGELSALNNHALIGINGVRERLRVLLVSGRPHPGERIWRNLLKSDASVDLVHFTILRPPHKSDFTPLEELSLIVFPVGELFETKLHEFDLIVFDRYVLFDLLPNTYLQNVADHVRGGGAILVAAGPEFAGPSSIFKTAIGEILPAKPTGRILEGGFRPRRNALGRRHPVTAALGAKQDWGRWFRQLEADPRRGTTLLEGRNSAPLLVVDRVGKGRVAQLLSDHIWLWARGFEGGGPHGELLRRLAHWLMKEPDLEEESLRARVEDATLIVERQSLSATPGQVSVTGPSLAKRTVSLKPGPNGVATATLEAGRTGLYRIADNQRTVLAVAGKPNPPELSDPRATPKKLADAVRTGGGAIAWISEGVPTFRRTRTAEATAGRGWMGLRRNEAHTVTGLTDVPLLPSLLFLILVLGGLAGAWWREGR